MLTRLRIQSVLLKKIPFAGICFFVTLLIGIGALLPRAPRSEDIPPSPSPSSGAPERIAEEVDIFRERSRELAKQERLEAKKKSKIKPPPTYQNLFLLTPMAPSDVNDGAGLTGRVSHLIGPTFGRPNSITPLEVMPYILTDEHFFFGDIRGFVTNNSQAGGNVGLGYRHLREDLNAWGGASIWYDADQSTSKLFQQIGLSFEGLIQQFELRSNVYLPFTSSQTLSNTISNAAVVGNQLIYGRAINVGTALQGVDFEVGYSQPVMDRHVVRGFVGGYHFDGGTTGGVNGVKLRAEGVLNNAVTAQVMYTNDNLYGSNVMVGLSLQFPMGNNSPTAGWKQHTPSPFRYVERNYNVIVAQAVSNAGNQIATDPVTGKAYNVEQVYAPPPPGPGVVQPAIAIPESAHNGTSSNPFGTIAAAQAAGGDVIIVQSGSVIKESVTLTAGQHLFGQGNFPETLAVTGGGSVQIPNLALATTSSSTTQTPVFQNGSNPAVTLASNTEVAGFAISNSGSGIFGSNISNVSLHDLKFLSTNGDAIHLTAPSGTVTLSNIQINGATGNGVVFNGGNANISYYGIGNSITAQGNGLVLQNLSGGVVDINDLSVKSTGGMGLQLNNVATNVVVNGYSATATTGAAVAIAGNTGTVQLINGVSTNVYNTYDFTGNTTILSPKGAGFTVNGTDGIVNVQNLNVTSTASAPAVSLVNAISPLTFSSMTLNTQNATGLYAVGISDLLQVNGGSITTVDAPAVNIQTSTVNTTFGLISVNGNNSIPYGISLSQSLGLFTIKGSGGYATGGTIQNTQTGVVINSFGTTNISWVDFVTNGTAIQSTKSSQLNLYDLRINGSTGYAIDSLDDSTLTLGNSILTSNGALNGGSIRMRADTIGTFQSLFANNTITDANGTALQYSTTPSGAEASLATTVQSNTFVSYHAGSPIVGVNWNGPASLNVSNNSFYAYGANSSGVYINDSSTTDSLTAQVSNNAFYFEQTANQGTGIWIIDGLSGQSSTGSSGLTVSNNTIGFAATGGVGLHYALYGTSTDYIASNIITDGAGGATGMLVDYAAANSRFQIDANTINLLSTDLTTHQGIIFTAVAPTIQFTGTYNNLIYNTTSVQSLFSIPVNSATGGFYINGTLE